MSPDALIAKLSFETALSQLDALKAAELPLPHGAAARFRALIPGRDLDSLYDESVPEWWGYAATMQEFVAYLDAAPKLEFSPKRPRKPGH